MRVRFTQEWLADYLARNGKVKTQNRITTETSHLESTPSNEPLGAKKGTTLDSRFRVRCITRGKSLGDVDGRSIKACLDAFTKAGVWPDDKFPIVQEVSFAQEFGEEDQTIIEVWEIET